MSKRSDRQEAQRLARRNAYLAQRAAAESITAEPVAAPAAGPEITSPLQQICRKGTFADFNPLPGEDEDDFRCLYSDMYSQHLPKSQTEVLLVETLIAHQWRVRRAIRLQDEILLAPQLDSQRLNLFMRYQATHERSYYKALKELQNIQKEKRKNEIGFESQKRQNEALDAKTRLAHAKAQTLEVEAHCRQVMEAPIPGTHNIPFETLTKACSEAIASLVFKERHQTATE